MTVALPVASLELEEAHLDDKYLKLGSTKIETAEEVRQSHPCRKKNTSLLQAAHLQLPPPLQKVPPAPCLDYHRSQIILGWLHGVGDVLETGSSWIQRVSWHRWFPTWHAQSSRHTPRVRPQHLLSAGIYKSGWHHQVANL